MTKHRNLASIIGLSLLMASLASTLGGAPANAASVNPISGAPVLVKGSVPSLPGGARLLSAVAPSKALTFDIVLAPRSPAALTDFVASVNDKKSPLYHHFLAKGQFKSLFGPTSGAQGQVEAALIGLGLHPAKVSANGLSIQVTGNAANVESAFSTHLSSVSLPGPKSAITNTSPITIPGVMSKAVSAVIGLSTIPTAMPAGLQVGRQVISAGAATAAATSASSSTVCSSASTAAASLGTFLPSQLASAYHMTSLYSLGDYGQGVNIALLELEPYLPGDIATYQACMGTTATINNYPVDNYAGTGAGSGEAALDIEDIASFAPQATIDVYTAPNGGSGMYDAFNAMISGDVAPIISTSWGNCEADITQSSANSEQTLFAEAAAQGQTVLAASGDWGVMDCWKSNTGTSTQTSISVSDPASQPYVVGVGGTQISNPGTTQQSEAVWNNTNGAGGGGLSIYWQMPSYQSGPGVLTSQALCSGSSSVYCREVPDVSANAQNYLIFLNGTWQNWGGTSAAAPLWAAVAALIDASPYCSFYGASDPGVLPQGLYPIAASSTYASDAFTDITVGNNDWTSSSGGLYQATTGYDMASGLGSPIVGHSSGFTPGLAALMCHDYGNANLSTSITSATATGGTSISISGSGFLPLTGADVLSLNGSNSVYAQCSSTTACTAVLPTSYVGQSVTIRMYVEDMESSSSYALTLPLTPTSFTASAAPPSVVYGASSTLSETGLPSAATGTITFSSGSTTLCVATLPTTSCTTSTQLGIGNYAVTATYSGSSTDAGSSANTSLTVDAVPVPTQGYWLVAADGGIFPFGAAVGYGSMGGQHLNQPIVGMAATPDGKGYWLVAADGGIFPFGDAVGYGSTGGIHLNKPIVGMAATPDGKGYWLVASDGGIFSFGDAVGYGSMGDKHLNQPIVGMAATLDGRGYWLVAADGGIFPFGDAGGYGSTGGIHLNKPIVGMASTADGKGYWLVAADGGIFPFGDAGGYGSTGGLTLNKPMVGMATTSDGKGYWLVAADGGIFPFGDSGGYGSTGGITLNKPIVGMSSVA